MILVDTGAFYALADRKDVNHRVAVECLDRLDEPLATHNLVLTESWYLLASRLGRGAARRLMDQITRGRIELLSVDASDVALAMVIEERYSDLALGLTDAVSLSLCNRERITRVFTFDRKDFGSFQPKHAPALRLLPD
jgi:predicted nucleic acid-binding protein